VCYASQRLYRPVTPRRPMKTIALMTIAAVLFFGLFRVEVAIIRKSGVERRAEELTESETVDAVSKFVGRKNAAYLWAESTMIADCYRQATAQSVIPDPTALADCESAIHKKELEFPFLSVEVAPRFEVAR
jgi:hypothetical protein